MIIVYSIFLYFFSTLLINKSIKLLNKFSLIDYPGLRSNHTSPTPKGAGIIIIPLIIISTLILLYFNKLLTANWILVLLFCLLLSLVSFIDDLKNLSTKVRLLFHFFIVASSLFLFKNDIINLADSILNHIESEQLFLVMFFLTIVFSFFWIWIINLYNFMDGMDGLTTLQICSVALLTNLLSLIGKVNIEYQILSLIILTVFIAFYKFNKSPAKVFLGDVGSISCGFLVGFIMISNFFYSDIIIPFLIINMYYLLDSSITLILRIITNQNIFQAHSSHFYQKIIRRGYSHEYVLKRIIILNSLLLMLGIMSTKFPISALFVSIILSLLLLYFFETRKSYEH
jgi:UDP-N-acetylmuramyl pentapeptide phosphotransferase/UDP-N-acetylglucosamine-1-phosphate transferase